MDTKYTWGQEEFHPTGLCFFCKKRAAVTHDHATIYKVIRNTTGFPGYVVNYAAIPIPVPACARCFTGHLEEKKHLRVLQFIAWATTTALLCCYMYSPADGLVISLVFSMLIALPLSFPLFALIAFIWTEYNKDPDEMATTMDYPVVKKLLKMGWQCELPRAKYGDRKNEDIVKPTMDRLNAEYRKEGKEVFADFIMWCRQKESQNSSISQK